MTSPDIDAIIVAGMHAPSSHNTQPWVFRRTDDRVTLIADRRRALPVNDPDDRELTISCGCALMNLRVAAASQGRATRVATFSDDDDPDLMAHVALDSEHAADDGLAALAPAIETRRTCRQRFGKDAVPAETTARLEAAARDEGASLTMFENPDARERVAALVSEGDKAQWANPSWRRELAAWMHPRRKGDGIVVPGLVAPVAQLVVRSFDMGNGQAAKDTELASESPVLALIGTRDDRRSDWLTAGQALERVLLTAAGAGLQASYLNQPIQVARLRPKLRDVAETSAQPQILLRLGFPTQDIPPAPRRPFEDIVEV